MKSKTERRVLGALLVVVAMSFTGLSEGLAKSLMLSHSPQQVVWARFAAQFLLLAPFIIFRYRGKLLNEFNPRMQILRATPMVLAALLFGFSIAVIPLGRAVALFTVAPFIVALLSFAMLGERVRAAGFVCIAGGFGGVLLIARPDGDLEWGNILAIASGVAFAFYQLVSRKISGNAPAAVGGFFVAFTAAVGLAVFLPFINITSFTAEEFAILAGMGALNAFVHYSLIRAFDFAPAAFLSLFTYWEIAAAVIVGFLLHGDIPDLRDWTGIVVIVVFGIAMILQENRAKKAER